MTSWFDVIYSDNFKTSFLEMIYACGIKDPMGVYMNWHRKQTDYNWFDIIVNA